MLGPALQRVREVVAGLAESEDPRPAARAELLQLVSELNSEARGLQVEQARGELGECGAQRLDTLTVVRGPLWLAVNTSLQAGPEALQVTLQMLQELLQQTLSASCSDGGSSPRPGPGTDCERQEYTEAGIHLAAVDSVLQTLFKPDKAQREEAALALVELQAGSLLYYHNSCLLSAGRTGRAGEAAVPGQARLPE